MTYYSGFSKKEIYQLFLKFEKSGFTEPEAFLNAQIFGITSTKDYNEFLESEFVKKDYSGQVILDKESSAAFLQFKELKFKTKNEFDEAKELGFTDPKEYTEYKKGNFETKKQYLWVKNELPQLILELHKDRTDIIKKSEELFNANFYGEAFKTRFILLEKKLEEVYMKTFREKYPKRMSYWTCFDKITEKIEGLNKKAFRKWKPVRNKLSHGHMEMEKQKAQEGFEFVQNMIEDLERLCT